MTANKLKQTVAENISRLRQKKGLTGYELSIVLRKTKQRVYLIESGKSNPTIETLNAYANALDCEAWELMKPFVKRNKK